MIEVAAGGGLLLGLGALWRGFRANRTGARIEGLGTSPIARLAAGEVRVRGTVESAGVTVISPILARECIYYDSTITSSVGDSETTWHDTRAVGFFVRDASGTIRVLPRDAQWDLPLDVDDSSGLTRPMGGNRDAPGTLPTDDTFRGLSILVTGREPAPRRMTEAVLEPGDPVTVVGFALPYRDLTDPASADAYLAVEADDVEVADDLAEARAAGILADNPEEAWGNAAIPGFGIGAPVRPPELDPELVSRPGNEPQPPVEAPAPDQDRSMAPADPRFEIPADALVLASTEAVPLMVAGGPPPEVAARSSDAFLLGLLGAVLAIGSAIVLALSIGGRLA